jgi:phosphoglycolate phosphatase-like HAD superfamily hydrolase
MKMIGFDADGVLLDSRVPTFNAASKILGLLGVTAELANHGDYERYFGAAALNRLVGQEHAGTLRMTLRLTMRQAARSLPLFHETLAIVSRQRMPCIVITASLAEGVRAALGPQARLFQSVTGFETNRKSDLLAAVADRLELYVTDTVSDIRMCQELGIPTIAVIGGFDGLEDLAAAKPTLIARNADELAAALTTFDPQKTSITEEN